MSKKQQRQEDPHLLSVLPPAFTHFSKGGLTADIECLCAGALPPELITWAFLLCKRNMEAIYEQSHWGWKDAEKRRELTDPAARLLIAYAAAADGTRTPLAYLHFRFLMEEEWPVAYCWELQVDVAARGRGLGQRLMQLMELMGARRQMQYAMLTVQTANAPAAHFYHKLGYSRAPHSPDPEDADDAAAGHVILWKALQRGQVQ